jgi:hypothetical protein
MVEGIGMFRKNDTHLPWPVFSSIDSLPQKQHQRLEQSWAGTFSHQFFCRIDEQPFAILSSEQDSRPTTPVNVLVGFETLTAGFGWSDEEADDHCCFAVQVRSALGSRALREGPCDLRTVDNVRQRVTQPMQETGENLIARGFEQVTDAQIAAFPVQTSNLRMDRTLIASTIRQATRLQVLVEGLQRTQRMLDEADHQRSGDEGAPARKGASGQDIAALRRADDAAHRPRIGAVMQRLVREVRATDGDEPASQVLARVFQAPFIVEASVFRAQEGQEWSAASLPSPDDWEATSRCKHGQGQRGSVANVSETCHLEHPFPLMVNVQRDPNTTDDAARLAAALPELAERSDVDALHTDGGSNRPQVDDLMQPHPVRQGPTAIRGLQPTEGKVGLEEMTWQTNADNGPPACVTGPGGQRAAVVGGRKAGR